jgi:hypothetical protein
LNKAFFDCRLVSLVGRAVGSEEPLGEIWLLADFGAPAVHHRFGLVAQYLAHRL